MPQQSGGEHWNTGLETTQSLCKSYRTCCLLWQKQIAWTTSSSTRTTFIQVCFVLEVQALALTLARATLEVPSLVRRLLGGMSWLGQWAGEGTVQRAMGCMQTYRTTASGWL